MPQNYRLIAVQIGDLLKYDATVNEIGRAASSLFRFARQSFPNDAITSQRAQLLHDWILTLARQNLTDEERDRLLVSFCTAVTPEQHTPRMLQILEAGGVSATLGNREAVAAFSAREFHPQIVTHGRKLFLEGNYFHAVFEVAKAYNKQVREKAQSSQDGQPLMLAVWGCDKGVLKITPCKSDTDRNVQDGIKFLSAGLMQAIRNPTAHEPAVDWPISRQDCLDVLSFISFLFRKLDEAVYYKA
jgi:uncharacterized protein (TIGR02391 family)